MSSFLHYLTLHSLLRGAVLALEIAGFGLLLAWPLALVLALLRRSRILPLRYLVAVFIWVMRGTPILLQLIFLYNVLPMWGIHFNAFWTAVIGLGLNESAFSAEIIRGGLMAVGKSQLDAAASLGFSPVMTLFRVQLPQALRIIVPTLANEAIAMVKNTSLASVIAVSELTLRSEQIVAVNFEYTSVFAAAAVIYLLATSILVLVQRYLERALDLDRKYRRSLGQKTAPWPASVFGRQHRPMGGAGRSQPEDSAPPVPVTAGAQRTAPASFGWLDYAAGDGLFAQYRQEVRKAANRDSGAALADVVVRVSGLDKSFGSVRVLDKFSLSVQRGEVLCILGPSGSGKSTLLRVLDGLDTPSAGTIEVSGMTWAHDHHATPGVGPLKALRRRRVHPRERLQAGLALVFQQFNLFQHRTVLANVMEAPTKVLGIDNELCGQVARMLLHEVGLDGREKSYPHHLSGGQQQRVAIARSLMMKPRRHALRRADVGAGPRTGWRGPRCHARAGRHGMTMIAVTHEMGSPGGAPPGSCSWRMASSSRKALPASCSPIPGSCAPGSSWPLSAAINPTRRSWQRWNRQ